MDGLSHTYMCMYACMRVHGYLCCANKCKCMAPTLRDTVALVAEVGCAGIRPLVSS